VSCALVTGGAGFIGSHLCERLLADGMRVVVLDNLLTGSEANLAHLAADPRLDLVVADAETATALKDRFTHVLHFASPASPVHYLANPVETLRVGSAGTLAALDVARRDGARFLVASTSEVYGDPSVHPQPETYWGNVNSVGPRSVYDEAKRFAEAATMAYRRAHSVDTAIVRIFNTYGPRMQVGDGRAVPVFVEAALLGSPLPIHGDGSQTRSLTYVDDLVEAVIRLLHSGATDPVNVGNPHELTVMEIANLVCELAESTSTIEFLPRPVDDPERRRPDITRAQALLEWQPQISLRDGLMSTIEWFKSALAAPRERTLAR